MYQGSKVDERQGTGETRIAWRKGRGWKLAISMEDDGLVKSRRVRRWERFENRSRDEDEDEAMSNEEDNQGRQMIKEEWMAIQK